MGIYAEFLILYIVLFFSGSAGALLFTPQEASGFSASSELIKTFLYTLPSLALIWHLLLNIKSARLWGVKPGLKDLISGLITLPCLLITGFVVAFASYTSGSIGAASEISAQTLYSPSTGIEWAILCFSCIASAYLEETFFRFYILTRRTEVNLRAVPALIISVALFSICHIYEGPWGFLNAVLSGAFLCLVFLRYKAYHGNAISHAMYNIAAYLINVHILNQAG